MPSFYSGYGRLTKDATVHETDKCNIINISMASSTYSQGKNMPDYQNIVIFANKDEKGNKQLESLPKFYKGRWVAINNGKVVLSKYTGKDGVEREKRQVQLNSISDVWIDPDIDKLRSAASSSDPESNVPNDESLPEESDSDVPF